MRLYAHQPIDLVVQVAQAKLGQAWVQNLLDALAGLTDNPAGFRRTVIHQAARNLLPLRAPAHHEVTTLEGEITTLEGEVTTLEGEVTTLEGQNKCCVAMLKVQSN